VLAEREVAKAAWVGLVMVAMEMVAVAVETVVVAWETRG
jgi:hypothetical protein